MIAHPGVPAIEACVNCGAQRHGPFCSTCGERKVDRSDYSIATLAAEVLGDLANFDTRILRTVKTLVMKPGELTRAYFSGGRSRYTRPLTLFVVLNVVFFLIQPHTDLFRYDFGSYTSSEVSDGDLRMRMVREKLARTREPLDSYRLRFNDRLQSQKKSLLIVSVPLFALLMWTFFFGRRYLAESLVYAVHFYAFLLLLMGVGIGVGLNLILALIHKAPPLRPAAHFLGSELALVTILAIALSIYNYQATARAFGARGTSGGIRALALTMVALLLVNVYKLALFFATLWTT